MGNEHQATELVGFRTTRTGKAAITAAATQEGTTVSGYLRRLVVNAGIPLDPVAPTAAAPADPA